MKTLIISGGSSGIGQATADLFASRGYRVYELSRSGTDRAGVRHVPCDVQDEAACQAAVNQVFAEVETVDVVICNAGWGIAGPVEFTDTKDAHRLMDVNFFGAFHLAKAVLPQMRKQGRGYVLFTSSIAAILPVPYQAFYSASKAAVQAMALALQNELRPWGIRVSCLLPGDVRTGFTAARQRSVEGASVYARAQKAVDHMAADEQNGLRPETMARIFWRMAHRKRPNILYIGGAEYKFFALLQRILPARVVNYIEGILYS